jgi:HPt (histidine-containing phosphotransfer) domain-containing protein
MVTDDLVLNVARLVEAFENDTASIANLLTLARETEKRYLRELRAGIAGNDIAEVTKAAHSIKGSASNIGAAKVSAVAARIEDLTRVGNWDGVAGLADDLDAEFDELCGRISEYAASVAVTEE